MLATIPVERLGIVGTVVNPDPVTVDGPPTRRQQLDVVIGRQRHRNIAGNLHQLRVLLVRRHRGARCDGISQSVMGPVLPIDFPIALAEIMRLTCTDR